MEGGRMNGNIREANREDLAQLLALYTQLHGDVYDGQDIRLNEVWERMLGDCSHHMIVAEKDGRLISSCVLVIVPNLTHGIRPYALIENVVTDENHRRQGWASRCLNFARGIATQENCYKIMLMTGAKKAGTLRFYEQAGYNRIDKTAFIQWLP